MMYHRMVSLRVERGADVDPLQQPHPLPLAHGGRSFDAPDPHDGLRFSGGHRHAMHRVTACRCRHS